MIPEIFNTPGVHPQEDWEYAVSLMSPKFAVDLARETGVKRVESLAELDAWTTQAATYILRETDAQVIFTHWVAADMIQHQKGRESPELSRILNGFDHQLQAIVERLDPARDQLFVVGDHGMSNVGRKVHPNVWIAEKNWGVFVHAGGGDAAVYLSKRAGTKSPSVAEITKFLEQKCDAMCHVVARGELDQWQAFPGAVLGLVASAGYAFGGHSQGAAVESLDHVEGQHGYPPESPEMDTSMVAWGKGWLGQPSVARGDWRAVARILRESLE
jgi:hypothetical protein